MEKSSYLRVSIFIRLVIQIQLLAVPIHHCFLTVNKRFNPNHHNNTSNYYWYCMRDVTKCQHYYNVLFQHDSPVIDEPTRFVQNQ
jgi:hypothetical protein